MATTGIIQGKNLRAYVNGSPVGYATDFTLTMTTSMIETLHKDSGANVERLPDQNEWSATGTYFMSYQADPTRSKFENLFTAWNAQSLVTLIFQTAVTGDTTLTGTAYITELGIGAPVGDKATGTWSMQGSGAIVKATY
jgi:hypothetical protein